MNIEMTRQAIKDLDSLDTITKKRASSSIDKLATNPPTIRFEQMKGKPIRHKIRVGDYRIVLIIDKATDTATITKIGHRREVYE